MHVGSDATAAHEDIDGKTALGTSRVGEGADHSVPVKDGRLGNPDEEVVGVGRVVECVEGEDATGDVGVADEAEGDQMGMDYLRLLKIQAAIQQRRKRKRGGSGGSSGVHVERRRRSFSWW